MKERQTLGATRERMVREICEVLEVLTTQSPLILVLEDLHWVDHSTLDVISAVARRREMSKLLLVGTYRPVDVILSGSQSGTSVQGKGYISKRGNGYLRHMLFNAAFVARRRNPDLKRYHEQKMREGKHYFSALCAVERKLVHLIYAVWKRGTPFVQRTHEKTAGNNIPAVDKVA